MLIFNWRLWAVGFVAFLLIFRPLTAASLVHRGEHAITNGFDGLSTFVDHI